MIHGVTKNISYIGETKRALRERFMEHIRDATHKTKNTPLGEHTRTHHPTEKITNTTFSLEIICTCKDVAELKITESIEIRKHRPSLNTQTSSWKLIPPLSYNT